MAELANIIILLDDARYSRYGIKLLIVGVPGGIAEYFMKVRNLQTVGNRIIELREVANLSDGQVKDLVDRGMVQQLQISFPIGMFSEWVAQIAHYTLGLAQRVHEFCEFLAHHISDNDWAPKPEHMNKAVSDYLSSSLRQSYHTVESFMNERETKAGRRNQVLYTLGRIHSRTFSPNAVEEHLRELFPSSTKGIMLATNHILSELASAPNSIIKRTPKGNAFEFTDPKYIMCLRIMLGKDEEKETVYKADY